MKKIFKVLLVVVLIILGYEIFANIYNYFSLRIVSESNQKLTDEYQKTAQIRNDGMVSPNLAFYDPRWKPERQLPTILRFIAFFGFNPGE